MPQNRAYRSLQKHAKSAHFIHTEDLIPAVSRLRSALGLLISKQRIDAKVIKKYDRAKTPYQRLTESSDVSEAVKAEPQEKQLGFTTAA